MRTAVRRPATEALPRHCPRAAQRVSSAHGDVRKRLPKVLTYRGHRSPRSRPATRERPRSSRRPAASGQRSVARTAQRGHYLGWRRGGRSWPRTPTRSASARHRLPSRSGAEHEHPGASTSERYAAGQSAGSRCPAVRRSGPSCMCSRSRLFMRGWASLPFAPPAAPRA